MDKKKKQKAPIDINALAESIVARATHEELLPETIRERLPAIKEKNPAAVVLGRLGGLKGGKARAAQMTKEELVDRARKAAKVRWSKSKKQKSP